jgi:hypothetical protein
MGDRCREHDSRFLAYPDMLTLSTMTFIFAGLFSTDVMDNSSTARLTIENSVQYLAALGNQLGFADHLQTYEICSGPLLPAITHFETLAEQINHGLHKHMTEK